ncbi:MAG: hypothetical protein EXR72_09510 [Myxococcales bacterium]|nr:hypothetical protein [Myxococcales bacterium]
MLLAMHEMLVKRGVCLRDQDEHHKRPTLLVFPSYHSRERPDLVGHPAVFVSYRFAGPGTILPAIGNRTRPPSPA